MKKILITLSVLLTLSIAGILYATQGKSDEEKTVTLEQVYKSHYSVQMPQVILTPNNIAF